MGIKIIATGRYVPERVLTNADLEKMVETSDEWIRTRTGIETRHIADASQATSDMCREAAKKALEMAGIAPSEVGAIVVATITPDHSFPNTACLLQEEIGAKNAFCFDLSAACSGLIYSLVTAQALMKMTPNLKYVLVLGAENFVLLPFCKLLYPDIHVHLGIFAVHFAENLFVILVECRIFEHI